MPAIPDKKGRLPGQRRTKKVVVFLPPLDPIRFPRLHNPEANGLALDPTIKVKRHTISAADDNAEKTLSEKLAATLRDNRARVLDLFRQIDADGDGEISRAEFTTAFQEEDQLLQGVDVPTSACAALFDEWDIDGSGSITFAELKRYLSKRPTGAGRAAALAPLRRGRTDAPEPRMCYASPRAGERKRDDRWGGRSLSP